MKVELRDFPAVVGLVLYLPLVLTLFLLLDLDSSFLIGDLTRVLIFFTICLAAKLSRGILLGCESDKMGRAISA